MHSECHTKSQVIHSFRRLHFIHRRLRQCQYTEIFRMPQSLYISDHRQVNIQSQVKFTLFGHLSIHTLVFVRVVLSVIFIPGFVMFID